MPTRAEDTVAEFLSLLDVEQPELARLMTYFSADARYFSRVRHAQPLRGRAAIEEELRGQFSRYRDCRCQILSVASNGAQVFTERADTVTMRKDGRQVTVLVCAIFDIGVDGKISYWREYWDLSDIEEQMKSALSA
jgi:limonene-1,2-epoxide hydrolase